MKWLDDLKKLDPCGFNEPENKTQAWGWCQQFKTLKAAWAACERGDWMLWLWTRFPKQVTLAVHRKLVLCACEIARSTLQYVPKGEKRPLVAIEAGEAWAKNTGEPYNAVWSGMAAWSAARRL